MQEDSLSEKEYPAFVVNRTLSYFVDTIMYANEINQRPHADQRLQYDYLRESIRSSNRFSKWNKKIKNDGINAIKKIYGYSDQKAREAESLLSEGQIKELIDSLSTGGRK